MSQFCPSCGTPAAAGALHCTQCGASLPGATAAAGAVPPTAQIPVVPGGPPPPGPPPTAGPPPADAPGPRSNTALIVAVAVLATLVVVGLVALVAMARSGDDDPASSTSTSTTAATTTTTAPTTTTSSTTTSTSTTTTTTAPPPTTAGGPGDVRNQPAGLLCRDLAAKGYSYSAAVDYWRFNGQPDRMDADKNGIPCETVYPRSDVIAYWGTTENPDYQDVPTGLFCKDLKARGYTYAEAVAYWFATGAPDNMDADKNGIPCETVYSSAEVQDYWTG